MAVGVEGANRGKLLARDVQPLYGFTEQGVLCRRLRRLCRGKRIGTVELRQDGFAADSFGLSSRELCLHLGDSRSQHSNPLPWICYVQLFFVCDQSAGRRFHLRAQCGQILGHDGGDLLI